MYVCVSVYRLQSTRYDKVQWYKRDSPTLNWEAELKCSTHTRTRTQTEHTK